MDDTRAMFAGKRFFVKYLIRSLIFLFGFFSPSAVFGNEISILLMPLEPIDQEIQPFSFDDVKYSPYLIFDNTLKEWEDLELGKQHWICDTLSDFAKAQDVKIKIHFASWTQSLNEIKSLHSEFNIIQVPSTWTTHLIDQNIIDKWQQNIDSENYPEKILRSCQHNNNFYAVPWQFDLRVLFYRLELTDDVNLIQNFEMFHKCLIQRKEKTGKSPFCVTLERNWDILHNTLRYFWNGKIIEKKFFYWKSGFNREEAIDGILQLRNISKEGLVYYLTTSSSQRKPILMDQAAGLVKGDYDAFVGPLALYNYFKNSVDSSHIKVALLPQLFTDGPHTFIGGSHLAITTSTRLQTQRKLDCDLVNYLTNLQNSLEMSNHTIAIPARMDALHKTMNQYPLLEIDLNKLIDSGETYPALSFWTEFENDLVLNNFYGILGAIKQTQDPQKIELQIHNAANEVQRIIFLYYLKKLIPYMAGLAIVLMGFTLWLVRDRTRLKRSIRNARQKTQNVLLEYQQCKEEINQHLLSIDSTLHDGIIDALEHLDNSLLSINRTVSILPNHNPSAVLNELKNIDDKLDVLNSSIDSDILIVLSDHIKCLKDEILNYIEEVKKKSEDDAECLEDLELSIEVTSFEPPKLTIHLSNTKKPTDPIQIDDLTAGLLIYGTRNHRLYLPELLLFFRQANGQIPTLTFSQRQLSRTINQLLDIFVDQGININLTGPNRSDVVFKWNRSRSVYDFKLSNIESPIKEAQEEWSLKKDSIIANELIELVKKDPCHLGIWSELIKVVPICSIQEQLDAEIDILNKSLLRYLGTLYELKAYLIKPDVDKRWTDNSQHIQKQIQGLSEELYEKCVHLNNIDSIPETLYKWSASAVDLNIFNNTSDSFRPIYILAIILNALQNIDLACPCFSESMNPYEDIFKASEWFQKLAESYENYITEELIQIRKDNIREVVCKRYSFRTSEAQEDYIMGILEAYVESCKKSIQADKTDFLWNCLKTIVYNGGLHDVKRNIFMLDEKLIEYAESTTFSKDDVVYGSIAPELLEKIIEQEPPEFEDMENS